MTKSQSSVERASEMFANLFVASFFIAGVVSEGDLKLSRLSRRTIKVSSINYRLHLQHR